MNMTIQSYIWYSMTLHSQRECERIQERELFTSKQVKKQLNKDI